MSKNLLIFFLFFLILRVFLFNINISEWGDSYRFLRAAESLRSDFSYPVDEKRLPLFSVLIALNPLPVEMMVWAKILQALLTVGILFLTYRLAKRLFPDLSENYCLLPIACCLFSPVFLYWSLRVVGEVLLTFLVLLAFEIYYKGAPGARSYRGRWAAGLGAICGLAALTRYEGFLLAGAFGLTFLLAKKFKSFILHSSFFILVLSPWLIRNFLVFGNPLHSTYFYEPSTYTYNLKTVFVFLASLVFLFGFPPAFYFVVRRIRRVAAQLCCADDGQHKVLQLQQLPLLIFIALELLLILCWPAAVPRLFLPLIPFFTIFLVGGINSVVAGLVPAREKQPRGLQLQLFLAAIVLTILYVLSQYFLRLHFLVLSKSGLAIVTGLGLLSAFSWLFLDFQKAKKIFVGLFLVSEMVASFVVISNHRSGYYTVLQAALYAKDLEGPIAFSDETGIPDYILGEKGIKLPDDIMDQDSQRTWLRENGVKHIIATDEYIQKSEFAFVRTPYYVHQFRPLIKFERNVTDVFDRLCLKAGLLSTITKGNRSSEVYEVLQ